MIPNRKIPAVGKASYGRDFCYLYDYFFAHILSYHHSNILRIWKFLRTIALCCGNDIITKNRRHLCDCS